MDIMPTQPDQKCIGCGALLEYPRWKLTYQPHDGSIVYMVRCALCTVANIKVIKRKENHGKNKRFRW